MKQILSIVLVLVLCGSLQAQDEFKPLFSGTDLSGWISKKEKKKEKAGRFSVNEEEKAIHTYAGEDADSKQDVDYLYTEKEYSNYVLKLEYKWLDKRFKPRAKHDRDAGLLFHLHGDMEGKWPDCLEMQLGESDAKKTKDRYVTGDLWVIGKSIQVMNERNSDKFYSPGSELVAVGEKKSYDSSYILAGNEKPHGEWNEITLTVKGGEEAIFELNGKVVNRITNMTHEVDGKRVPLAKGRIGLQAEYAELMYRNIHIKELP